MQVDYNIPKELIKPETQVVFFGFPSYGVEPHEDRNLWTLSVIGELRRSLGWKKQTKTHDFRPWQAHGIQFMKLDGIHTFNILRKIRYEYEHKMVVVLVGAAANKFKPAIDDAPENILLMCVDYPGINVHERIGRFYGSDVFLKAAHHVGKDLDIWKIN